MQGRSIRFTLLTVLALASGACGGEDRPPPCGGTLEEACGDGSCPEDLASAVAWSSAMCDSAIAVLVPVGDRRAVGFVDA